MQYDNTNELFHLAAGLVENSNHNIYLTGKAGTGKTTFLKYIREHSGKKMAVAAPTGVAAINAGGVTLHSLFQLPFGAFVPDFGFHDPDKNISDKQSLLQNVRLNSEKKEMLQELELLVIDEVSMVRADLLDAIDLLLRHFRRNQHQPFGGLQVLFIGDLFQLPPVISDQEWKLLQPYYETPFFFSSRALAAAPPLYIELDRIYRQNEQRFIDILNRIRHNTAGDAELAELNSRYRPGFQPALEENYITLTTHNSQADQINQDRLRALPGEKFTFPAVIEGDFSVRSAPADETLCLKTGAQVMFVKNDTGNDRKFYNGKLAVVSGLEKDKIIVSFSGGEPDLELKKENWKNIRYRLDKGTDELEEEELGSFSQYPVRLAWAITIHKSQGLTFEKAIIDAGRSFAPGQVYVALSRCTSLNGMLLYSEIQRSSIVTDERVLKYAQQQKSREELENILAAGRDRYMAEAILKTLDWNKTIRALEGFSASLPSKKIPEPAAAADRIQQLVAKALTAQDAANKYRRQLEAVFSTSISAADLPGITERMKKAMHWFASTISADLLEPLAAFDRSLEKATRVRKFRKELLELRMIIWQVLQKIVKAKFYDNSLIADPAVYDTLNPANQSRNSVRTKPVKGSSGKESLEMFLAGTPVAGIAKIRNLTESTVGGHLAMAVRSGDLEINQLVPETELEMILQIVRSENGLTPSLIRERTGDTVPYYYIRATLNHLQWMKDKQFS